MEKVKIGKEEKQEIVEMMECFVESRGSNFIEFAKEMEEYATEYDREDVREVWDSAIDDIEDSLERGW